MRAPDFWNQNDYTAQIAVAALTPIGWLYGASVAWKRDHAAPLRPRAKVISIGNLSAGGTGKTPIAITIARRLIDRKLRPIILSRGYGGRIRGPSFVDPQRDLAVQTGDEPLLLANAAPVIVSRNRKLGAELADSENADVLLMDDAHQNFRVAKDMTLVVVDAETGFGNGRILPAGPLRESVTQGLARADAVVLVGKGNPDLKGFNGPILRAQLTPVDVFGLKGRPVIAFAGIGRPEKFFATLRALGADVVEARSYADHHAYTASEIARLHARARASNAMLITTEKDFVRLTPSEKQEVNFLPVRAAFEDMGALDNLLDKLMGRQMT